MEVVDSYKVPSIWNCAVLIPIQKKGVPVALLQLYGIVIQPALRQVFTACMA